MFRATDEQVQMGQIVADLLDELDPLDPLSALSSDVLNAPLWEGLVEMGIPGMMIPERWGGLELTFGHLSMVLEKSGYGVSRAPVLSNAIATFALMASGDDQANDHWLPRIAAGTALGTVAWDLSSDPSALVGMQVSVDNRLTGQACFVLDASTADLVLVLGTDEEGLHVFAVDTQSPGVSVSFMDGVDVRRSLGVVSLESVRGEQIALQGDTASYLERVLDWASIAVAVEQLGTAAHAMSLANEYVKVRKQFGRTIGSFQAIKHRMADMQIRLELARSAAYYAIDVIDSGSDDLCAAAAFARTVCTESLTWIAAECVQVHGGIGYTWDYPAQLFVRRAKSTEHLLRPTSKLRDQLAVALLS